jgi:RNA polymerase sigma-70 factor (ECF subfamily)
LTAEVNILLLRLRQGEPDALRELYDECRRDVYLLALAILRNTADAEDILQDVFVAVHGKISQYGHKAGGKAWLLSITRNLALNRLRSNKLRAHADLDELPEAEAPAVPQDDGLFEECLALLNPRERQILTMHLTLDLTHRETARVLRLPEGTVRRTYAAAINKLREHYKED